MSVHEMTQRYPSFGYQIYFVSEQSTAEIEAHVRGNSFHCLHAASRVLELPLFFRLSFRTPSQTNISLSRTGEFQEYLLTEQEPDGCILNDKVTFVFVPDRSFCNM